MISLNSRQIESQKLTRNISADFPARIGNFTFVKEFFPDKKVRHFDFAVYEDENGKIAIAKQWNKFCKYINRHWLINEINVYNVYKEIHRVRADNPQIDQKYPNMRIPILLGVVKEKDRLVMLTEKIDGQPLKTLSTEKQVAVFQNVIEYMAFLGDMMDSSAKRVLVKRSMRYAAAIFPFIFTLAVINHPKKFLCLLLGGIYFSVNVLRILNQKEKTLVHRDLNPNNIITKGAHSWIIDFQISAITNPAFEIAGLMIFLWNDVEFREAFKSGHIMESLKKDKNKFYSYKILSIYVALYNLGAVKTIPSSQVFSYLNYALSLKFSK